MRPVTRTRNQVAQVAHHLAAIADTEREGVAALEECTELVARPGIEQNRLGPALACPEHVAIREPAAGRDATECRQLAPALDHIAHVNIDGVEAGAVERRRYFEVSVHALLPQNRDAWPGAGDYHRWRGRIEGQVRFESGISHGIDRGKLGVGARRVVAQALDAIAGLGPDSQQVDTIRVQHWFAIDAHPKMAVTGDATDVVQPRTQPGRRERGTHRHEIARAHLQHRAEFFGEQRTDDAIRSRERREIDVHTHAGREHHLGQHDHEAAIRSIVIGEQTAIGVQGLDHAEEGPQRGRIVDVGHFRPERLVDLRETGAAETIATATEIGQQQARLAGVEPQFRRQRRARVDHRGECGDHQRHRRRHLVIAVGIAPRGAHRQTVLADRDADPERRTQVEADRPHGVEQRRVLPRLAGRGHPVGRQLHPRDGADAGRRQVRQRLAHRHPARRGRVDDRQRRALSHRHRLAENGIETHRGDSDIGDRHLPAADHLVARGHPADRAVTDGDQKRLVRHRREAQDAIERFAHVEPRGIERCHAALDAFDVALRARRFAEQHFEIHVDRTIGEQGIVHDQALTRGGVADDGMRTTFAPTEGLEHRELLRIDGEHVALLRFVAPDLQRRHPRGFRRHRAQIEHRTAAGTMHDLG